VVTASRDGTARVWDVATGEQLLELRASRYPLTDAGFDPAGLRIVTASFIGTARIYRCGVCGSLEDLLRTARAHVTRGLTPAEHREFLGE
jgi:WD40 repeat protein